MDGRELAVDDIVTRLRGSIPGDPDYVLELISEAATEIEQLREEVADWRRLVQAQEVVANTLRAVVNQKAQEIKQLRQQQPPKTAGTN